MPSTCLFQLDGPNNVYNSGQTVAGQVTLRTTSEKNVRKIRIRLVGKAKVHWEESETYTDNDGKSQTRTVDYTGSETYVDDAIIVRGGGILPPGTYTYNFSFLLPVSCPSSIDGSYGDIRYELCVTVDRPFRFDNEFSKSLSIVRTVDLNLNPAHKVRLHCEEISYIGCWPCCSSGNIIYNLTIPNSAYVPGQTLRYSLHVQNQSMTDITGYSVKFSQCWAFTAHSPHNKTRYITTVLVSKTFNDWQCLRQMNRVFENEIVLPPMPPTSERSRIVRVDYTLKLKMFVDGCHKNNKVCVPIFIGNVPLRESLPDAVPTAPMAMPMPQPSVIVDQPTPSAPLLPASSNENDAPPSYAELQPPSFLEAIRSESPLVGQDATEYNKIIGFRPVYPGSNAKK